MIAATLVKEKIVSTDQSRDKWLDGDALYGKEKMMSREYRRIYCCADCVHYSLKKHKCTLGAKDEGSGIEHFYRDCPFPIYEEQNEEFEKYI